MIVIPHERVVELLSLDECIEAVERAMVADAKGPASVSLHVDGGAFHVKVAAIGRYMAAKVNGNIFANPSRGLPRIRGTIVLADATNAEPLAVLDSAWITILRTGAATAVAVRHLAKPNAATLLVCGCGNQGRISVDAIRRVRPIERVFLYDSDPGAAQRLADTVGGEAVADFRDGVAEADVVVTCTPSRTFFFEARDAHPGLFIAAVGADSSEKQEVDPALLAASGVVVDDLEQCASFGDLRYALDAGLMQRNDVRATLGEVIAGKRVEDDVIVFDSTGTALQDVAAAAIVFEKVIR